MRTTGLQVRRVRQVRKAPRQVTEQRIRSTSKIPPPRLAPGTAVSARFFDDYPRFLETSDTAAVLDRLNLRYDAIFRQNDIFDGARVLDLASHDGRWSFAALRSGAREVVGIEARGELVEHAERNLSHYGVDQGAYRFVAGDVFDVLSSQRFEVDVVLCLGFLYHTLRYNELLYHLHTMNPQWLLIDTRVINDPAPSIYLVRDRATRQGHAVADKYSYGDRVLVGCPTVAAVRKMVGAYGFEVERRSDWAALLRDNPGSKGVKVYRDGKRATLLCRSTRGPELSGRSGGQ